MNTEQIKAATTPAPAVLVKAGPGSGKTTTLIARAEHLAKEFKPSQMCFVTFTNVGAAVLRKRLKEKLGEAPAFVGTLHSLMWSVIRKHFPQCAMIDEEYAQAELESAAKTLSYRGSKDALREAAQDMGYDTAAARVVQFYRRNLFDKGLYDFNMVLAEGYKLVRCEGMSWVKCLFVDEYQDSGKLDALIYQAINPLRTFIVGDTRQSIFGFRGARPQNMVEAEHSGFYEVHELSLNYRSGSAVCGLANAIIGLTEQRRLAPTIAATPEAGQVDVLQLAEEVDEHCQTLNTIKAWAQDGIAYDQMAVLCRTNALRESIGSYLELWGIPLATAEADRKPKDWTLLVRILGQMLCPENEASGLLLAGAIAKANKQDMYEADKAFLRHRHGGNSVASFFQFPEPALVLSMNANMARFGIGKASMKVLAEYIRTFQPEDLRELVEIIREDVQVKTTKGVTVTTAHGAKGEEWEAVAIPGFDLFRSSDLTQNEEEKRLAFVAITRAKRRLFITQTNSRSFKLPGGKVQVTPTRADSLFYDVRRYLEAAQKEVAS